MNQNELNPYVSMLFPDFLYHEVHPKSWTVYYDANLVNLY